MKPTSKNDPSLAWQKWQPQQFDQPSQAEPPPPPPLLHPEVAHAEADLEAQREVEALRAAVRDDAWQAGLEAGRAEGERQGYQQGVARAERELISQQQHTRSALDNLLHKVTLSLDLLDEVIYTRLIQLALEIAYQLTGEAVAQEPHKILNHVKQLVAQEGLLNGPLTLQVNPDDVDFLADQLPSLTGCERWQIKADPAIPRGDCRLTSAEGELESARLQRWLSLCQRAQRGEI